jgi:hypothetical protein
MFPETAILHSSRILLFASSLISPAYLFLFNQAQPRIKRRDLSSPEGDPAPRVASQRLLEN